MCCGNCNTQTIEDSDFCPEDGVTQNTDSSMTKERKPFYKKWWVWTIAVITVNLIITAVVILRKDKQLQVYIQLECAIIERQTQKRKTRNALDYQCIAGFWRRRRDLNPRCAHHALLPQQGSPFGLLGTSPCRKKKRYLFAVPENHLIKVLP